MAWQGLSCEPFFFDRKCNYQLVLLTNLVRIRLLRMIPEEVGAFPLSTNQLRPAL